MTLARTGPRPPTRSLPPARLGHARRVDGPGLCPAGGRLLRLPGEGGEARHSTPARRAPQLGPAGERTGPPEAAAARGARRAGARGDAALRHARRADRGGEHALGHGPAGPRRRARPGGDARRGGRRAARGGGDGAPEHGRAAAASGARAHEGDRRPRRERAPGRREGARRDRPARQSCTAGAHAVLRRGSWPEAEEAVRSIRGLEPGAPIELGPAEPEQP